MWNLKYDTKELIYKIVIDSKTQKTNLWLLKKKGGDKDKLRAWDEQIQTTIYKINNKVLLYSTGNSVQYPVISHNVHKYIYIYSYIFLNHFVVHQTLLQHYKSIILQFKKKISGILNSKFDRKEQEEPSSCKKSVKGWLGPMGVSTPGLTRHWFPANVVAACRRGIEQPSTEERRGASL